MALSICSLQRVFVVMVGWAMEGNDVMMCDVIGDSKATTEENQDTG